MYISYACMQEYTIERICVTVISSGRKWAKWNPSRSRKREGKMCQKYFSDVRAYVHPFFRLFIWWRWSVKRPTRNCRICIYMYVHLLYKKPGWCHLCAYRNEYVSSWSLYMFHRNLHGNRVSRSLSHCMFHFIQARKANGNSSRQWKKKLEAQKLLSRIVCASLHCATLLQLFRLSRRCGVPAGSSWMGWTSHDRMW